MIIYVFKKHEILLKDENRCNFLKYMGKMVRAGAGAGIFDKLEQESEPHKNGPAPQHCLVKSQC
jgi:hypothetical protein